jgi:hypothetical protein
VSHHLDEKIKNLPLSLTLAAACELAGGDKPIDKSTYWRKVKAGLLPAPNVAKRIPTKELLEKLGLA